MQLTRNTAGPEETYRIGKMLGQKARPGQVYALTGDLGVGKTIFTKGFAEGLGVTEPVTSPTFTILQSYTDGRVPLYHFDVYRIEETEEMDEIGYEDCFYGDGVALVEWAEQIEELLPEDTVRVVIRKDPAEGADFREIRITAPDGVLPELHKKTQ